MITRLQSALTATTVFSAGELPVEVQNSLWHRVVTPRIVSTSMVPTLQPGDRLELAAPHVLHIGDLVVYREGHLLICHRMVGLETHYAYTKGDASDGPSAPVTRSNILWRVTAVFRDGHRLSIPPAPQTLKLKGQPMERPGAFWQTHVRVSIRWVQTQIARLPCAHAIRPLIRHYAVVDVMERAPLVSLEGYVHQGTFKLFSLPSLSAYLATSDMDSGRIMLVIRLGSWPLGWCRLSPWSTELRPIAANLGLTDALKALQSEMGRFSAIARATA
jgi:hypothetical protein